MQLFVSSIVRVALCIGILCLNIVNFLIATDLKYVAVMFVFKTVVCHAVTSTAIQKLLHYFAATTACAAYNHVLRRYQQNCLLLVNRAFLKAFAIFVVPQREKFFLCYHPTSSTCPTGLAVLITIFTDEQRLMDKNLYFSRLHWSFWTIRRARITTNIINNIYIKRGLSIKPLRRKNKQMVHRLL